MARYEFDKSNFRFKKERLTFWSVLSKIFRFFLVTFVSACFIYFIFSLLVSTDTERRLLRENRLYERMFPQMVERSELVGDVITGLQIKDNEIYWNIFHSDAPDMSSVYLDEFISGSDTIPDKNLIEYTAQKADKLIKSSNNIEENFKRIMERCALGRDSLPPLSLPLGSLSPAQVGASVGNKINPFYKVEVQHNGLDLIAPQGDPVYAVAAGRVTSVTRSRKGLGNVVEITHEKGYVTRYCHLGDIVVRRGQNVRKGIKLGEVGISGNSFAPHLHFEVLKDGQYQDPVNFFFASVSPEEYANMLYMSVNTGQSLD